mmetsp:Transcript_9518/g.19984  ORF Transcript_9518/g.19984 Transcript_9518/m.19984 type:complete len:202 (-) Transcript_9518:799-1404(-)
MRPLILSEIAPSLAPISSIFPRIFPLVGVSAARIPSSIAWVERINIHCWGAENNKSLAVSRFCKTSSCLMVMRPLLCIRFKPSGVIKGAKRFVLLAHMSMWYSRVNWAISLTNSVASAVGTPSSPRLMFAEINRFTSPRAPWRSRENPYIFFQKSKPWLTKKVKMKVARLCWILQILLTRDKLWMNGSELSGGKAPMFKRS